MNGSDIVAHAPLLFLLSGGLAACGWASLFASWRWDARTRRALLDSTRDAEFVHFSRHMIFSVTDRHGMIYTRSLYELQDEPDDLTWVTPVATSLRWGSPCHGEAHGQEEDHARGRAA